MGRMINGSVSSYVLSNAPCAVCLMGKGVEDREKAKEMKKQDEEIAELSASASENEGEDKKMPFFLPRKHSVKNYYSDSDYACLFEQTKPKRPGRWVEKESV